jgi:hypothetical protein
MIGRCRPPARLRDPASSMILRIEMSKTLLATLLLITMRISAHHAFAAEYDENKRVSVSGT